MKRIIAALVLLFASMSAFAATEIWMMHSPTCSFCRNFLQDHNLEGINSGEPVLIHRDVIVSYTDGYIVRKDIEVTLVIVNLTHESAPAKVMKASLNDPEWRGIPYTPYFYRWDTETETITGHWGRGWKTEMEADFHKWILTGQ